MKNGDIYVVFDVESAVLYVCPERSMVDELVEGVEHPHIFPNKQPYKCIRFASLYGLRLPPWNMLVVFAGGDEFRVDIHMEHPRTGKKPRKAKTG